MRSWAVVHQRIVANRTNLPDRVDDFVDRPALRARLIDALGQGKALRVVGLPGVGKTRLAHETARSLLHASELDEAWVVELTGNEDESSVAILLATIAEIATTSGEAINQEVSTALGRRGRVAVIFDNAERCLDGVVALAHALEQQEVGSLITSRLDVDATADNSVEVTLWGATEAAADLFIARMLRSRPHHDPTDSDRQIAMRVARAVDGLPLALELAAARTEVLDLDPLARRLEQAPGTALARAFDWSWEHLTEDQKALLSTAALFAADFNAEALLEVSDSDDAALDDLVALRRACMLSTREHEGRLRLYLPRSLADFVVKQAPISRACVDRYIATFANRARQLTPVFRGADAAQAASVAAAEHENMTKAFHLAIDAGRADDAGALLECLHVWLSLMANEHVSLGLGQKFLAARPDGRQWGDAVVRLLTATGLGMQTRFEQAFDNVRIATEIAAALHRDDDAFAAQCKFREAWLTWISGAGLEPSITAMDQAVALADAANQPAWSARIRWGRATVAQSFAQDSQVLLHELDEIIQILAREGEARWEAMAHGTVAAVHYDRGTMHAAAESGRRAFEGLDQVGDRMHAAKALNDLSVFECECGDPLAWQYAREAVDRARRLGTAWLLTLTLVSAAHIAADNEAWDEQRVFLDELVALRTQVRHPVIASTADVSIAHDLWRRVGPSDAYSALEPSLRRLDEIIEHRFRVELLALATLALWARDGTATGDLLRAEVASSRHPWVRTLAEVILSVIRVDISDAPTVDHADLVTANWVELFVGEPTAFDVSGPLRRVARLIPPLLDGYGDALAEICRQRNTRLLIVNHEVRWFRGHDGWADLSHRQQLWDLLLLLTEQSQSADLDEVRQALWPGEQMKAESGKNRVYAAVSMCRKAGIPIVHVDGRYCIDPTEVVIHIGRGPGVAET